MTTQEKTDTKKKTNGIVTPEFRVSFPAVFTPKPGMNASAKPKYSIGMLFPKTTDLTPIKKLVHAAIVGKWGEDKAKWPKGLYQPFRDGAEKDYDGYGPDVIFATASSTAKPGLVDASVQPIIAQEDFYGGCYARAKIDVYAFEAKDTTTGAVLKRGVSFGLVNVQKMRDGEPFSGRTKAENDFDAITVPGGSSAEAEDPLAGL